MIIQGACSCGSTKFEASLPAELASYSPRACDCDFCISREALYLSDPKGRLEVSFSDSPDIQRHGSGQAEFLHCPNCGDLVCVTCSIDGNLYGTLNSSISPAFVGLGEAIPVSPKTFSAEEKLERWRDVWFPAEIRIESM